MQTLHKQFHLAGKPGLIIVGLMIVGLAMQHLVPREWQALRTTGVALSMFCGGILASQHMAIWEKSPGPVPVPAVENEPEAK